MRKDRAHVVLETEGISDFLNTPLDLVRPCLDRLFRLGDCVLGDFHSPLKGDQGKAAPNPIFYFQSP